MIFVTQKKSVYVDSVAGSDANDGLTEATPKATCAAGMTVLASSGRKTIRLKCGSFFREQINLPAGKRLKNYGSGARPILDPRENIAGPWTLYGAAYTYQKTVNHALSSPSVHRVWEDGVRLKRVANVATVETTPGSFYAATPSGTTGVLYIHPNGDGDPNSNGKTYSYSYRMYGVDMEAGCTVDGVDTGWNGGNDGSIRAIYGNCVIRNCVAKDGAKHNLLIAGGVCEDVVAYDAEPILGIGSQTAFIVFNALSSGSIPSVVFRRCSVDYVTYTPTASVGFYGHGGINPSKIVIEDCTCRNCAIAYGSQDTPNVIVSRSIAVDCGIFSQVERAGTTFYIYRCRSLRGSGARAGALFSNSTVVAKAYIRHSECSPTSGAGINNNVDGGEVDVRYCQFTPSTGASSCNLTVRKNGLSQFRNCVAYHPGNQIYNKGDSTNFQGYDNLYYAIANPAGTSSLWAGGGTVNWTWTQWKANTGQDTNSVLGEPIITAALSETAFSVFAPDCPVYTSGFTCGVQPTDDAETLSLLASVGYTP